MHAKHRVNGWAVLIALVAGSAILTVSTGSQADDDKRWKHKHHKHHKHHTHHTHHGPVFIPPGHLYHGAPVTYVQSRPVVVYDEPVIYRRVPTYYHRPDYQRPVAPGVNLVIPLR